MITYKIKLHINANTYGLNETKLTKHVRFTGFFGFRCFLWQINGVIISTRQKSEVVSLIAVFTQSCDILYIIYATLKAFFCVLPHA